MAKATDWQRQRGAQVLRFAQDDILLDDILLEDILGMTYRGIAQDDSLRYVTNLWDTTLGSLRCRTPESNSERACAKQT